MFLKFAIISMITFPFCNCFDNNCAINCSKYLTHYKELDCKPVHENCHCCPTRFDCIDFNAYDINKCYYKGKTYSLGDPLPEDEAKNCREGCFCSKFSDDGQAVFECLEVDCAENLNPDYYENHSNCIGQHSLNGCCIEKDVCDPNEIEALPKCYYNGKAYHEGEYIDTNESCYYCICGTGFDNTTSISNNRHCAKVSCDTELQNLGYIRNNCAPTYYQSGTCCPHTYTCPVEDAVIIPNTTSCSVFTDAQCKFGHLLLNVGDIVPQEDKCIICTCQVPPLAVCITDQECYVDQFNVDESH